MNVYATNNIVEGYELQGSFADQQEAELRAKARGWEFAVWWSDDTDEDPPEWVRQPAD